MLIHVKMTRSVYERMRADLKRPHDFARERVGFIFARKGNAGQYTLLLLATEYSPVPDAHYLDDPMVGAKINSSAIRSVMERAYSTKECILHVHTHGHPGVPQFSRVDRVEYNKMIPSFHNIGGDAVHGALVFSRDSAAGLIWTSKQASPRPVSKLTIVDYPMKMQTTGTGFYV